MNKTIKSIVYSLIAAVFVIGAISGFFIWDHARKEASLNETLETLTLKADESLLDIEYGDSFDPASVITSHEGAQLIFTTHDAWQLSNNLLRRDEIWFTEKQDDGNTILYSLADFVDEDGLKIRKDESFEKNYLLGKYGAIPNLKAFDMF